MQRSRASQTRTKALFFPDGRHQQPATPHDQQNNTIYTVVAFRPTVQLLLHKFQSSSTIPPAIHRHREPTSIDAAARDLFERSEEKRANLPVAAASDSPLASTAHLNLLH